MIFLWIENPGSDIVVVAEIGELFIRFNFDYFLLFYSNTTYGVLFIDIDL